MTLVMRVAALAMVLSLLGGCATMRGWFSSDKKKEEKPAELLHFDAEARIERVWRTRVGRGIGKSFANLQPTIAAGYVIAADAFGVVEAHELDSGKRAWRTTIGDVERHLGGSLRFWKSKDRAFVTSGVGGTDDLVLIGTERGEVVALNSATGSEVWRARVSSEVLAPPAVNDEVVVLQAVDGKLTALDRNSGERLWSYDTQVPILTLRGTSAPVLAGPLAVAGFANGRLSVLNASQGNVLWEQRVMLPQGRSELERIVDVDSTPLVADNIVYAASFQGRLKAMRLNDGRTLWEHDISTYQPLARGFGYIYVVDESDHLLAIDETTGVDVWEQPALHLRRITAPVAFSSFVAVGDADGYVHVFAQSDGRPVARRKVGGGGVIGQMLEAGGVLYGQTRNGSLFAVRIERR